MKTTFFVPRGESCPILPGRIIGDRLEVVRFLGSFETPAYIGHTFELRLLPLQERPQHSQRLAKIDRFSVAA